MLRVVAFLWCAGGIPAAHAATTYEAFVLPFVEATNIGPDKPNKITDNETIVGSFRTYHGGVAVDTGFHLHGGVFRDLAPTVNRNNFARAVGPGGQIVGDAQTWGGIWYDEDLVKILPGLNGALGGAFGVNGSGWIAGRSTGARAAVSIGGVVTELGTLGGTYSSAYDINDAGDIVGSSGTAAGTDRAFLFRSGTMTAWGTLGGPSSLARAINRHGQAVGWAMTPDQVQHAVLFHSGGVADLGLLGGFSSEAHDINSDGRIVGQVFRKQGNRPFVFEDGRMVDLMPYLEVQGFTDGVATSINDKGQIVGYGTWSNGSTDVVRGFLLTPVGAPYVSGAKTANAYFFQRCSDGTNGAARFNYPVGLTRAGDGMVFIADGNRSVRMLAPDGTVTTVGSRFYGVAGVAAAPDGSIVVSDGSNHTVVRLQRNGDTTVLAGAHYVSGSADGGDSGARFNGPGSLGFDDAGNLYIADVNNHTIRKRTPAGIVTTLAGSPGASGWADGNGSAARFNLPRGIAVAGNGTVYVADTQNHTIRKVSPTGEVVTLAGVAGLAQHRDGKGAEALFNLPYGLALDGAGNLYVAERANYSIRRIAPDGTVKSVAGSPTSSGHVDGLGSAARLDSAFALGWGADGGLLIACPFACTLRKMNSAFVVSTVAGVPQLAGHQDGRGWARPVGSGQGIAADARGNVYFSDSDWHVIRKIHPDGRIVTLAGTDGVAGSADGLGGAALFSHPAGVAVDAVGNVFVADQGNRTIRKITPDGLVSTLAGVAGVAGIDDGKGAAARFTSVLDLAVDRTGLLWVADGDAVRNVSADGTVSTFYASRSVLPAVKIGEVYGLTVDAAGNVYVAEWWENRVTRISPAKELTRFTNLLGVRDVAVTPSGAVLTLASTYTSNTPLQLLSPDGRVEPLVDAFTGRTPLIADSFDAVTVDPYGTAYTIGGGWSTPSHGGARVVRLVPSVRTVTPAAVVQSPVSQQTSASNGVRLAVEAAGTAPFAYQWYKDGVAVGGATSATLELSSVRVADGGNYTVRVTNAGGTTESAVATVAVGAPAPSFFALSTRAQVGTGANVLIPGFVISGGTGKRLLIRALGPKLVEYGLSGELADPRLSVTKLDGTVLATSDNWNGDDAALWDAVRVCGLPDLTFGSRDAALIATLPPGVYTAIVSGAAGTSGVSLVEFYDLDAGSGKLSAISARAQVGTGFDVLIPGIVIEGTAPKRVLIRVAGPNLAQYFSGALADPQFEVKNAAGTTVLSNDNWNPADPQLVAATAAVGAGAFTAGSKDAALVADLAPGLYTIMIRGVANTSGVALVELFDVP